MVAAESMIALDTADIGAGVDQTPLGAASTAARRNGLEGFFQRRPVEQDLKDRHILLDTTAAPALQAAQQELARHQAMDNLKRHLEKRPDKMTLVERNILPSTNAAPVLVAHACELERNMRADSLEQKLQKRPTQEDVVKSGIVHT